MWPAVQMKCNEIWHIPHRINDTKTHRIKDNKSGLTEDAN